MLFMLEIMKPRDLPHGSGAIILLIFPVAWSCTIFYTYRNGYMYCGHNDKVYRKDEPKRFMLWLAFHALSAIVMFAAIIYAMLT
jgi:hypothetical protein